MDPRCSFRTQSLETRQSNSHQTSQLREEKTSKFSSYCNPPPQAPPLPGCQVAPISCSAVNTKPFTACPSMDECHLPCKPSPGNCCTDSVCTCSTQICIPEIQVTTYPPTVCIQQIQPKVKVRYQTMNSDCHVAAACNSGTSGAECESTSSYKLFECTDKESSIISHTNCKGKSKVLFAQDSENMIKRVTCKDLNGMSNTYSKESSKKSTTVCCEKGKSGRNPCKDCVQNCIEKSSGGTGNAIRYSTKVNFNQF